jgi:DUF1009 family protein
MICSDSCPRALTLGDANVLLEARHQRPIGLLAGGGRYPLVFAQKAHSLGFRVVCLAVRGSASAELARYCEHFYWTALPRMGRVVRCLKRHGVVHLVMAGKIQKAHAMFRPWRFLWLLPDWRTVRFWYLRRRADNRDDTIMLGLIKDFARDNLHFESPLTLCPELLVRQGLLTRRRPSAKEEEDIRLGWELAKKMGELDVGQSVAVRERVAVAVEAIEGTDQAIQRAGQLCRGGSFVVIKVAKPRQDMRFDVPTVGCDTIEALHQAGGKVLAIEADKTIVLDQDEVVARANSYGISIVALSGEPAAQVA